MPASFDIVPEIGGVDTTNPERDFSPEEQKAVIEALFGAANNEGPLILPGGEELYVGTRGGEKKTYSIGRENKGSRRPAIFIPRVGERPLLEFDKKGGVTSGMLMTTVSQLLSLGRHTMLEAVEGEEIDFIRKPSSGHKQNRLSLTRLVIGEALLTDPGEDATEPYLNRLYILIDLFLGGKLGQIEVLDGLDHPYNWQERPFEEFFASLAGRVAELSLEDEED